jgi:hypothetical protein
MYSFNPLPAFFTGKVIYLTLAYSNAIAHASHGGTWFGYSLRD